MSGSLVTGARDNFKILVLSEIMRSRKKMFTRHFRKRTNASASIDIRMPTMIAILL